MRKKEQDVLLEFGEYVLVIIDEFPQLPSKVFERIYRIWEQTGKTFLLLCLGDFHQLPSIEGTNAKDSGYWKHVFKAKLHTNWRAEDDDTLKKKLGAMRKNVPTRSVRIFILRGHKAWDHRGAPNESDIRALYRSHQNTTLAVDTKKGAQELNDLAAKVAVGRRRALVTLACDYEDNAENFNRGELIADVQPKPAAITMRRGLRLVLTKNLDKENDFVNGMRCTVKRWNAQCNYIEVETITGKPLEVYQYTDPDSKARNLSYFPLRLGYAGAIYKLQGAELPHVTIYLKNTGQRAAAYVAMSRVKKDCDYLFGGWYTKKHFVPNN